MGSMFTVPELKWLEIDQFATLQQAKSRAVAAGLRVLDLSMINPDIPPPRLLLDRLLEATTKPRNHRYSVARGIKRLREGFAKKYQDRFGIGLDAEEQVCVTMGSKDALINLLWCLTHANERVIVAKPTYPAYAAAIKLSRLEPLFFEVSRDRAEMLAQIKALITGQARPVGLLLNFPNNPTGITVDHQFYQELYKIVAAGDLFVVNDFVYGELSWGEKQPESILSVPDFADRAVEVYSMSKAYSIPGWRVAAVVGNREICGMLAKIKAHVDYGLFMPLQLAAVAGLTSQADLTAQVVEQYRCRAELLASGIERLGWQVEMPKAGCSLWARFPHVYKGMESLKFCCDLAEEKAVFLLPGELFGSEYRNYVRFALVLPEEPLREVIARLSSYQESIV